MFLVETELDYFPLFSLNWFESNPISSNKATEILSPDNVLFMSPFPQKDLKAKHQDFKITYPL